jgi:hypothetical protein
MKNYKSSKNGKKELRKAQSQNRTSKKGSTPCNTLTPLDRHYHIFLLSTTMLAKSSINFVPILSPFGNELIKHKPREEQDVMQEIQN